MKTNRSIRFHADDLALAEKLKIDINEISRNALQAEIIRRLDPEYKKNMIILEKQIKKALGK